MNGIERLLRDIDRPDLIGVGVNGELMAAVATGYPPKHVVPGQRVSEGASTDGFFLDWQAFWNQDRQEHEWLKEPILARGRGHSIYGAKKIGKSDLTLWMVAGLATGTEPVVVVYLDFEMTGDDVYERLLDFGYGPHSDLSRLRYALLPSLPPLDRHDGATRLLEIVDDERAKRPDHHVVVIIDTTSRAVIGDENSADTIRDFYRYTGLALKQRQLTWVRLDHAGKDATQGQRGSSAKGDDVDVVWQIKRTDDGCMLVRDAARMSWVPERVALRRDSTGYRIAPGAWPEGTKALADELDRLDVPIQATQKVARAALSSADVHTAQAVLVAAIRYRKSR